MSQQHQDSLEGKVIITLQPAHVTRVTSSGTDFLIFSGDPMSVEGVLVPETDYPSDSYIVLKEVAITPLDEEIAGFVAYTLPDERDPAMLGIQRGQWTLNEFEMEHRYSLKGGYQAPISPANYSLEEIPNFQIISIPTGNYDKTVIRRKYLQN